MASDSLRFTVGLVGLTVGLAGALLGGMAHAAPPTEADFQVTYFLTDEVGDRQRQLSTQDMTSLVNQARCECDQQIVARIGRTGSNIVDAVQVLAMVGQQCATAQASPGFSQYALCAQLVAGLPTVFQNAPEYRFGPIWLAHGTSGAQSIEAAEPAGDCASIYGQGGIWMCTGTECMMGTFFMQGTSNINVGTGGTAQGISFDFVPPLTPPSNFEAQPGDSAVEIVWDATSVGDISGYRVLCADAEGNPVGTFDYDRPTASTLPNGQHYYTRDNLCPGGAFGENYTPDGMGWDDTTTDTGTDTGTDTTTDTGDTTTDGGTTDTGGTTTDGGTTDGGTTTGGECTPGTEGCICDVRACDAGLQCVNDSCESTACQDGENNCPCVNGACDPGYECGADDICGLPSSGIQSLDWSYICSPHISGGSQSARIEGLENGTSYQFLVVAYDVSGNPLSSGDIITATPIQTNGLWEQCEAQGNVCGEPGFCAVAQPSRGFGWLFGGLALIGLAGLGIRARRRRLA